MKHLPQINSDQSKYLKPKVSEKIQTMLILFLSGVVYLVGIIVFVLVFPNKQNNVFDSIPLLFFGFTFSIVGILGLKNKKLYDIRPLSIESRAVFSLLDLVFGYDKEFNLNFSGNKDIGGKVGLRYSVSYFLIGLVFIFLGLLAYFSTPNYISENNLVNNGLYANPLFNIFLSAFMMFVFVFVIFRGLLFGIRNSTNKIMAILVKLCLILVAVIGFFFFFRRTGCYLKDINSQPISDQMEIVQVINSNKEKINGAEYKNNGKSCKITKINIIPYFIAINNMGEIRIFSVPNYIANKLRKYQKVTVYFYKNMDLMVKMRIISN